MTVKSKTRNNRCIVASNNMLNLKFITNVKQTIIANCPAIYFKAPHHLGDGNYYQMSASIQTSGDIRRGPAHTALTCVLRCSDIVKCFIMHNHVFNFTTNVAYWAVITTSLAESG